MDRKKKAAKAINTATGLIVILVVILFSPLFGYGRGFASKEQRMAAALATAAPDYGGLYVSPAATPRPTARPTPAPVVLPSAPPTPEPTPEPTPRPVVQQTAVQQTQQQYWPQDEYWGEAEYEEAAEEEAAEETAPEYDYTGIGEQPVENESGNYVVETENADIVFQGGDADGSEVSYEPAVEPVTEYVSQPEVYVPSQPESSEGEAFLIG